MTTFFFVRHAVTAHTGKKLSGWTDGVPLTELGESQADAVAESLAELPLAAVYSSPIDRTIQTARAIAARHDLQVRIDRDIGEVGYGRWTNRSLKVLARTKLWEKIQTWPSAVRFPDGETLREVQTRALGAIEKMAAAHPRETICCVSHGDVIKLVMAHYMGIHIDLFQRLVVAPASISVLNLGDYGPRVLSLNAAPMSIPTRA